MIDARMADRLLDLVGWKPLGEAPKVPKFVLIAAPHTSNWDLPITLLFGLHFGLDIRWVGKHTLFQPPLGWLMKKLGGLAVDRRNSKDQVKALASLFDERDRLCLLVPAEGTRGRTEHWKSGFYYIALTAGVPIALATLDYGKKQGGFGPLIMPTGDVKADMDRIRAFYADKQGLYPDQFGPVRLKQEPSKPS